MEFSCLFLIFVSKFYKMEYKNGDKHPTKNRIFWSYSHKKGNPNRKEMWMTPEAFQRKAESLKKWQNSPEYKEKLKRDYLRRKDIISQRDKDRKLNYRTNNPFALMLTSIKPGAKRRNLIFDITLNDLQEIWDNQKGKCYYTGLDMNFTFSLSLPKQMSLDRIDSSKGYTKDNVVLCCQFINYAKHDYKLEDFLAFLKELKNS